MAALRNTWSPCRVYETSNDRQQNNVHALMIWSSSQALDGQRRLLFEDLIYFCLAFLGLARFVCCDFLGLEFVLDVLESCVVQELE